MRCSKLRTFKVWTVVHSGAVGSGWVGRGKENYGKARGRIVSGSIRLGMALCDKDGFGRVGGICGRFVCGTYWLGVMRCGGIGYVNI